MKRHYHHSSRLTFFLSLIYLLSIPSFASTQNLFTDKDLTDITAPLAENVFKQLPVSINTDIFESLKLPEKNRTDTADILTINLFNGQSITALLDRSLRISPTSVSWIGHTKTNINDQVILTISNDVVMGTINQGNNMYQIRYLRQDDDDTAIHLLKHIDVSKFPQDHPDGFPNGVLKEQIQDYIEADQPNTNTQTDSAPDDGSVIDVMVVYTPNARTAAGGTTAINTLIDLAVTETIQGYVTSGITTTINLVHKEEVNYTETATSAFNNALSDLAGTTDGKMDNVHTLRNTYAADLVSLLIDDSQYCGLGYLNSTAATAFQVTAYNCATGYYSFAHEFGHNQGAKHDWRVDATSGHNHGYVNIPSDWRTIMAYNDQSCPGGSCSRLNFWSNPDRNHNGEPTGIAIGSYHEADNRKALNDSANIVSNFRVSNVTGDNYEPDNNSSSSANIILDGQAQDHSIHTISDQDWVTFTLSNNTDIKLETTGVSGDTQMWLYDNNLVDIGFNDDGGTGSFSEITRVNLPAGTYFVKIDEYGNNNLIDSYQLSLSTLTGDAYEPDNSSSTASTILNGQSQIHSIHANDDQDWATFIIPTSSSIVLETSGSIGSTADTRMWLYDSSLTQIEFNDDGGANAYSKIALPNLAAGTYYVKVDDFGRNNTIDLYNLDLTINATLPIITSPTPSSTISGTSETFVWDYQGATVEQWALYAGSTPGTYDYFVAGAADNATSVDVTGLPINGTTIYIQLWYRIGAAWASIETTYTAASSNVAFPSITSPVAGSTLSSSSETFTWNYNGSLVEQWALYAGSTPGIYDYFVGGATDNATTTIVTGLPNNGSTIYIKLWYRVGAAWASIDATYTANSGITPSSITTPPSGNTLSGTYETFTWDYNGNAVEQWALYAGSAPGTYDYFVDGAVDNATTTTVTGLPTNGSTVYIKLWYRIGTAWASVDASYTAISIIVAPSISNPAFGETLSGSSTVFSWDYNGNAVEQWALYAGSTPGTYDYFVGGAVDSATTTTVTGLPANGNTVYIQLWYRIGAVWASISSSYISMP